MEQAKKRELPIQVRIYYALSRYMKKENNLIKEAKLITDAISDGFEVLNESLGEGKPKMIILKGIYA